MKLNLKQWFIIMGGGLMLLGVWFWFKVYIVDTKFTIDIEKSNSISPGEYGDLFGVVTSLFAVFAFYATAVALILQFRELGMQRTELSLTRLEFNVTRATNVLYRQLDKMELAMNKLNQNHEDMLVRMKRAEKIAFGMLGSNPSLIGQTRRLSDNIKQVVQEYDKANGSPDKAIINGYASTFHSLIHMTGSKFIEIATVVTLFRDFEDDLLNEIENGGDEEDIECQIETLAKIVIRNLNILDINVAESMLKQKLIMDEMVQVLISNHKFLNSKYFMNQMYFIGQFVADFPVNQFEIESTKQP